MKHTLCLALLALCLTSCETMTKLSLRGAEFSMKFEEKTGVTPAQGWHMLTDWYAAYQAQRAANRMTDPAGSPIPLHPSK